MEIYRLGWVCEECYTLLCELSGQELETKTITNLFQAPCSLCGRAGTRLADLPKAEEDVEEKKESDHEQTT